jgi:DNA (cytosine-5)-methyltransferase 1
LSRSVTRKLKAVDFFCGAGGMSCGFTEAGIKVLAGIDIEKRFEATYTINHPKSKFINRDIIQYTPEELQNDIGIEKHDDSLIFIGCSPCQYWSKINNIRHNSVFSNNLLYDFQRFVKYFKPGYVVVENVPGIIKQKNNHLLLSFLDFLLFNGYKYEYRIVRTDDYGVPQKRSRFLLIATRIENKKVSFPEPEKRYDLTVHNFIGQHNGFPRIPDGFIDSSDFMHSTAALTSVNKQRIISTPKDGGTRMAWKDNPKLQLAAYKNKDHYYRSIYGRLYWHQPASTITTRFISTSCGRFSHPEENRGLSLREGATLQTFPKSYKFIGGLVSVAKQIGNAVPPELARRIASSIINKQKNDNFQG